MKLRLAFLLKFYVWTVVIFMLAKMAFMMCLHDENPFTTSDVWQVLRHGLTLDLSTALYFLIVPFLICVASIWMWVKRWLLKIYYGIVAAILSLAFVSDTSLYPFWHFKLDASCLDYLLTPTEAMASVSTGYLLGRLLLVLLAALLIYKSYMRIRTFMPLKNSVKETLFPCSSSASGAASPNRPPTSDKCISRRTNS